MAVQGQNRFITIGTRELERLIQRVALATDADTHDMLDAIGQQQEDSARRRIGETKMGPNGKRWAPWSASYAKTRGAQHSLLVGEGNLRDSLTHSIIDKSSVEVGSNLVYAGRHLFGDHNGGRIPARPYLDTDGGFADPSDRDEIRDIVRGFLGGII
jgi:phage virion morphogenesis protein